MRKILLVLVAMLLLGSSATAEAQLVHYRLAPVSIRLRYGHVVTVCRSVKGIPASASLLTWARVNGSLLPAAEQGNLSQYFAGRGTLVDVFARSTTAPVCVRAITWQHVIRLRVTFKIT